EEDNFTVDLKAIGRKAAHAAEREAIRGMLAHTAGNKREEAERLGISYKAILYKIREYGISRPRSSPRPTVVSPPTPADSPTTTPALEQPEQADPAALPATDPEGRSALG